MSRTKQTTSAARDAGQDSILTVEVDVSGGVVQYVHVPNGVRVIVRDFDIDGTPPNELTDTDDGPALVSVYGSDS